MALKKPTFRPYHQDQLLALPPSLEDLIPADHSVRVVIDVINRINIEPLLKAYHIKGGSNYHPLLLLKILVYGYVTNLYSSRRLAEACRERIPFMWLSAMSKPDHNTINRFRGVSLKHALRCVFEVVVQLLAQEGLLGIDQVYTDGTKIEANANKYTFVWRKAIQTNKEKMKKQLEEIWNYTQHIATAEDQLPEPPDLTRINTQSVTAAVEKLNKALADQEDLDKKVKAKLKYITKNYPANIPRYEHQEAILGERNSYSKTDPDANFMRMKEDHMSNGQLKPGYNIQISTSNQFIVNYTVHANPTDTLTLKYHLEQYESSVGNSLKTLTADAGYGSEENYALLEEKNIEGYVKYGLFDKNQNQSYRNKFPFHADQLFYDAQQDVYICSMDQQMRYIGDEKKKIRQLICSNIQTLSG